LGLAALLFMSGCTTDERIEERAGATESAASTGDSLAYNEALALESAQERTRALKHFLASHPENPLRAGAYRKIYDDLREERPEEAWRFLSEGLEEETDPDVRATLLYRSFRHAAEFRPEELKAVAEKVRDEAPAEAGIYNAVAWELAERGEHLEIALTLARQGAVKADEVKMKGYVLDTVGWIQYKLGRYDEAVASLEAAAGHYETIDQELGEHLAKAYGAAGRHEKALGTLIGLLADQEDPDLRSMAETMAGKTGMPLSDLGASILEERRKRMEPAADFTLADLDGNRVSLSDWRGKVVLLNFWSPT
jgi:tetratricopeptide (TPR) repeat protein